MWGGQSAEVWVSRIRMGQGTSVPEDVEQAVEVLSTISGKESLALLDAPSHHITAYHISRHLICGSVESKTYINTSL